jgi:hypothetical protein
MVDHEVAMCAYVQLAVISHQKQQQLVRDRFLLLAGVEACRAGWLDVAERCRKQLLANNPSHQLRNHATMPDAMRDASFQKLAQKWEHYCPFEQAEHLLRQLGLEPVGDNLDIPRGDRMLQLLDSVDTKSGEQGRT